MTLNDARLFVRQFGTNAMESTYTPDKIDRAIISVGDFIVRRTKCTRTTYDATVASGNQVVDLTGAALIKRYRVMGQWLTTGTDAIISATSQSVIARKKAQDPTPGRPYLIAYTDDTHAKVWPVPDQAYTLTVEYWQPFTSFTPGTSSPGTVTLNLPDEVLSQALPYGATAVLQHNEPEHAYAAQSWQQMLTILKELGIFASDGAKVIDREKSDSLAFRDDFRRE